MQMQSNCLRKNTSRQLTRVRAQMHVKKFNHQPLCFLKTESQVSLHLGCQIKPGAPVRVGKRQRAAVLERFTKHPRERSQREGKYRGRVNRQKESWFFQTLSLRRVAWETRNIISVMILPETGTDNRWLRWF